MEVDIIKICEIIGLKNLSGDEQLITTGLLDSFLLMELICTLEEEDQIRFEPSEIADVDNFSSVKNIVRIVNQKKAE